MSNRKWVLVSAGSILIVFVLVVTLVRMEPEYAYMPDKNNVSNVSSVDSRGSFDVWGRTISSHEAAGLASTDDGRRLLSPHNGAVKVDDQLLHVGREAFYKETFGNEVFLTDVMGIVNGPITMPNMVKALVLLRGRGTTNLQVEIAKTVTVGGKTFEKGTKVDTGIDVARGSFVPLGMPVKFEDGNFKIGISCAGCHATVDPATGKVIEGAPNSDLNTGVVMAMATNSAAYFTHTNVSDILKYVEDQSRTVTTTDGKSAPLPDRKRLEDAVDSTLLKWPRGNFDSTIDLKSNPAQIPDSFTLGDHPYGWSGFAAAGPFKGLSTFSNNVHAQNSDSLAQADASKTLFGIDKEVYLGTILQNAANPKYRYHPESGKKPSAFFAAVDPTPGVPGINEMVVPPSYPKVTLVAPDGLIVSSPGHKMNEQNNAMAAWQNTLVPPKSPIYVDPQTIKLGWTVFNQAGCATCHSGLALTNNKVIPEVTIGTEPSRAQALTKSEQIFGKSFLYSPDTMVPVSKGAHVLPVPTNHLDSEQLKTAFAHGGSLGGYKVPSLIGLYWSAPYLHDGGVAVGRNVETDLGMPGTLIKGIQPDPVNSLRAIVDRDLRSKVIAANRASVDMRTVHVQGMGHEHWVDKSTGFTKQEQDALIKFLLTYNANRAMTQIQAASGVQSRP